MDRPDDFRPDNGVNGAADTATDGDSPRRPPSIGVLEAVTAATGTPATDLRPLYEVVDPDALDDLFRPSAGDGHANGAVSFRYAGCTVTVHADGRTDASPIDDAE